MPAHLHLLTYSAQVRQQPFKSEYRLLLRVFTMHPFLLTQPSKKHGISRRGIVITGTVRVAVWEGQSKSMGVWLKVVGLWLRSTIYISSLSLAEEKK